MMAACGTFAPWTPPSESDSYWGHTCRRSAHHGGPCRSRRSPSLDETPGSGRRTRKRTLAGIRACLKRSRVLALLLVPVAPLVASASFPWPTTAAPQEWTDRAVVKYVEQLTRGSRE